MTEINNQDKHSEKSTDSTPAAPRPPQPRSNEKKPPYTKLSTLALGVSVLALATSGWLYVQSTQSSLHQDVQRLSTQQSQLNTALAKSNQDRAQFSRLTQQVTSATQQIKQQAEQKNQLTAQLSEQNTQLADLESKINRLNNTTKEDWKLAEAEYLIRLANQRLLLESDGAGSARLLINADDILNALEDPIAFDTRKALANDIQALKSVSEFDLEGAYLKLNALYQSVENLPQREPSQEWQNKSTAQSEPAESTTSNHLVSVLNSFWASLRSLIVINYDHKPIKALLPPAEYQQLVTGIQLQLDIAQVALIKGETVIYQQALSRVANATTIHFDTQASTVMSFLSSLTALQALNPAPELPLPSASLVAMKALTDEWNRRRDTRNLIEVDHATPVDNEKATLEPTQTATPIATETTPATNATEPEAALDSKLGSEPNSTQPNTDKGAEA
ncbi:uroporphyrinogen-III C-methyltransferase [Marinomonas algarum]|uniref:Uroporphyrinogen-III C-methyltransferase n=1 Tax=Marinomonas algarum TaxID=2883105 RepID=A0A9X1IPI4_9GAMM|nr:uroporphyrinogen-III C-methyltransferase [Marinomonas algarum]MCB5162905.1 uroporphyrinogen-III C-methyltransferase [Marinomonas algarum]